MQERNSNGIFDKEEKLLSETDWSFANFHTSAGAWIILALSALITLIAWHISSNSVARVAQNRFQFKIEDIRVAIEKRMKEQEVSLWSGVGLFDASDKVTRSEWKRFVASMQLSKFLPGLQGYGYAEFVAPEKRQALVEAVRSEGFADFDIKPDGERELYSAIIYLEPFSGRNLRAFGYDMWSEPTRRKAMMRARDTGEAAVSGMVTLVQETSDDVQRGFLMYLPVYRHGLPTKTPEERRAAIKGYVYSPFRIKDLMNGIIGKGDKEIGFRIFDGEADDPSRLLYDSAGSYGSNGRQERRGLSDRTRITIGGRAWTIVFRSREDFIPAAEASQPLFVAVGGILIDILLFLTISSLSNQRRRALEMATNMTSELRSAKERAENAAGVEVVLRTAAQEANAKLQEANAGLMKFTSIIAHDLRAPLKRIEAFIEILREDHKSKFDHEGKDILERIERGSSRMRLLLDSMHDYSKYNSVSIKGKIAHIDDVVSHAIENLGKELIDATVNVDLDCDCAVHGDPALLENVMQNLFSNSVKFCAEEMPVISVSARLLNSGYLEIEVTDNGIGIEPRYAEKIFEMFTRLHNDDEYEGVGIGLAVCRKIIRDHGGEIKIDSNFSGGTRVIITLPSALEYGGTLATKAAG